MQHPFLWCGISWNIRKNILWINIIFLTTQKHIVSFSCGKKFLTNNEAEIEGKSFIFALFFNRKKKQKYLWNILSVYHVLLPDWQLQSLQNKAQGYHKVSFDAKNQFFYKRKSLSNQRFQVLLNLYRFQSEKVSICKVRHLSKINGLYWEQNRWSGKTPIKNRPFLFKACDSVTLSSVAMCTAQREMSTLWNGSDTLDFLLDIFVRISMTSDSDNVNLNSFFCHIVLHDCS